MANTTITPESFVKNKSYTPDWNDEILSFFTEEEVTKILNFQKTHPLYNKTPLHSLKNLANYLNVAEIKVKDESERFGLNAFKVLGGIYAIGKYLAERLGTEIERLSFSELQSPEVKEKLGEITFISATDGNHGKGIAWAARELGQKSVIHLPKGSSKARLEAIRQEGAQAEITDMNYDATVRRCAQLAEENGWVLVQDTAWDGYEEIPRWIMQGYASIAQEIIEEEKEAPTHIFLQAGVGTYTAGIAAYFMQVYQDNPPKIVVVEPNQADCFFRTFVEGERQIVTGDMDTIMAGLACGEPNMQALQILEKHAWGAMSCGDSVAALGMRVLGNPLKGDPRIISGESGAVPLGLVFHLLDEESDNEEIRDSLELDRNSRILLINTEGDTDPEHYLKVVWKGVHGG